MSQHQAQFDDLNAKELTFSIIGARYNSHLVDVLIKRATETLIEYGADRENIKVTRAPGSNELPYLASMQGMTGEYDCIIALGVVIAGDTEHHDIIAQSTAVSLHTASMNTFTPIINGIITVNTEQQADDRVTGPLDRGAEFARAAIEMGTLSVSLVEEIENVEAYEYLEEEGIFDEDDEDDDDDMEQIFRKN
ncbi:MAG: 6,7-dimethyl-8-ribityllumazine synthase [Verrucomicrobiota bacterium]